MIKLVKMCHFLCEQKCVFFVSNYLGKYIYRVVQHVQKWCHKNDMKSVKNRCFSEKSDKKAIKIKTCFGRLWIKLRGNHRDVVKKGG